jgi:hypothetical protein
MRPTVCLLTAYNSAYDAFAALTIPRMQAYANRYGYVFRAIRSDDCERRGGWIKIAPIRAALAEQFDYVFWIDADALIVRQDIDIAAAMHGQADLQMAWHGPETSRLDGGDFQPHFNSGVMLIRATEWSRSCFARVWDTGPVAHAWNDQATILHLLGRDDILELGAERPDEPDRSHVDHLDCIWNSIPGVAMATDPVVHHYAGLKFDARLRLLEADVKTLRLREAADPLLREAFSWQLSLWRNDAAKVPRSRKARQMSPSLAKSVRWSLGRVARILLLS